MSNQSHILPRSWWKRFVAQRRVRWLFGYLGILILLALLAPVLSSDLPFSCDYNGKTYQPYWQPDELIEIPQPNGGSLNLPARQIDWHSLSLTNSSWTLIPYQDRARIDHRELSPFGSQVLRNNQPLRLRFRHWLGTDQAGRDILALILHGIRITLGIGFLGILLAGIIGFTAGSMAGYFGDDRLLVPSYLKWSLLPVLLIGVWGGFLRRSILFEQLNGWEWWQAFAGSLLAMVLICGAIWLVLHVIWKQQNGTWKTLRMDFLLSRVIEILDSLPQLLLIISLGAILSRDIWTFLLLISLTSWSGVARLVRAETLRIRNADYITAARISRIPARRILWRHIWPQVLPMLLIPLAFGVGNIMIAESSLSFLGIIEESHSWGSILSEAVHLRHIWWLPVFPGLAIFFTVLAINVLGESLRKALSVGQ